MNKAKLIVCLISAVVSIGALSFTIKKIYQANHSYVFDQSQITSAKEVTEYLQKNEAYQNPEHEKPIYVPTGIFIESMRFLSANIVHASGYVWQKYDETNRQIENRGVVLPEGTKISMQEAYRRRQGDVDVIGWYFETELIQNFSYNNFPLDHQVVWLRMWHKEFDRNIILVPDFEAYDKTGVEDHFGVDPEIVLFGYDIKETFFNFNDSKYDTNFGIKNYVGQKNFPELYYNAVLKRNISNSLVVYFLPLSAVFVLLFFSICLITIDDKKTSQGGFNLANMIRIAALLLFIVILSHIQLRNNVSSIGIIYIEYFYFIAYVSTMLMVLACFVVSRRMGQSFLPLLYWQDVLLVKAAFIPGVAIFLAVVTALKL